MDQQYLIQKGDFASDTTELVIESDTDAYTEDFDMEIRWESNPELGEYGVASVDGQERAIIEEDAALWHATPVEGGETLVSDIDPFIALAHLAYIENW